MVNSWLCCVLFNFIATSHNPFCDVQYSAQTVAGPNFSAAAQ